MTNTNPAPNPAPRLARPIPKASDFAPLERTADRSRNNRRGARNSRSRRWVL